MKQELLFNVLESTQTGVQNATCRSQWSYWTVQVEGVGHWCTTGVGYEVLQTIFPVPGLCIMCIYTTQFVWVSINQLSNRTDVTNSWLCIGPADILADFLPYFPGYYAPEYGESHGPEEGLSLFLRAGIIKLSRHMGFHRLWPSWNFSE